MLHYLFCFRKRNPTAVKVHEKSATGKMGTIAYASKNKQLVLVNINGVLYRNSTNKLQKSVSRSGTAPSSSSVIGHSPAKPARKTKEHFLIIRGVRFALDRTGMKLRSVGGTAPPTAITGSRGYAEPRLNRIDIGGLTYKARKDGTFIRTDSHRTRNHLSVAKQRSIQVLASKLKKCNEPCHIYRRLGKCLAHQRGKCPKVHDPKHVSICQRFLRGECLLDGCLLSHDITSLEKMPVCRFFLEGRCVRDPCPYLHKKVSESVRICDAFLNGFCTLADKVMGLDMGMFIFMPPFTHHRMCVNRVLKPAYQEHGVFRLRLRLRASWPTLIPNEFDLGQLRVQTSDVLTGARP